MADLAERIYLSRYVDGVHATTSMHTLLVAQTPEFQWETGVLRVDATEAGYRFEFVEQPFEERRWVRECGPDPDAAFRVFERLVQHLHWFVEYRPAGPTASGFAVRPPLTPASSRAG